ncbi:MAG: sensor histidine kinase YpdA, partial [Bacteroidota bacterium]
SSRNGLYVIPNTNIQYYDTPRGIFSRHLARLGNTLFLCDAQAGVFSRKATDKTWKTVTTTLFENPRDANSFEANEATNELFISQTATKAININGQLKNNITFGFLRNLAFLSPHLVSYTESQSAGLIALDAEGKKQLQEFRPSNTTTLNWVKQDNKLLRSTPARAIAYNAPTHTLLIGYNDNLLSYNFLTSKIDTILDKNKQPIIARSLAVAKNGSIYCGTVKDGLYIMNTKMQEIAHFTTTSLPLKLINNTISAILLTDTRAWIASNNGLQFIAINPKDSLQTGIMDRNDGLVSNEISDIEYIPETHTIWITTPKGLQSFPENTPTKNTTPPSVHINRIAINERDTTLCQTIVVGYDQNDITIGIEGLAFRSRGNFNYHYRLRGLNDRWSVVDSHVSFARYPSLPMGKYDFEVYTVNEDGLESEKMATLHIEVLAPWWRKWWAYQLYLILIVAAIYGIYRWRFDILKSETILALRNSQIEQDLRTSQLSTLQVQMNPHFIFNALNSIQEYILLNEKRLANEYLGKFADLMRYTLDMSQQKEVPLADEINALKLYLELENLRFDNTLLHKIEVADAVAAADLKIPSMLLQPYVENAIKHGLLHREGEKRLHISFYQETTDRLICIITDNGIGRVKAMAIKQARKTNSEHRSFATTATQKRLELLNHGRNASIIVQYTDLYNQHQQALGTKVVVSIPV